MSLRLAFRLSAIVLGVCLLALACDLAVYLLHISISPKLKRVLDVAAFIWPLPAVFFGTYQKKLQVAAQDRNSAA
jgi:hypothetical protein